MVDIISVHVQKTAGSAFGKILEQAYEVEQIYKDYKQYISFDQENLPDNIKVIHGHFTSNKYKGLYPEAKRIVWLRHPIARLISHYFFWKTSPKGTTSFNMERISLIDFANAREIRNHMSSYVNNIEDFDFVGIQEFFIEDVREIQRLFGWSDIKINSTNRNSYPDYHLYCQEILSNYEVIRQIYQTNREDFELYENALNIRAKRMKTTNFVHLSCMAWQKNQSKLLLKEEQIRKSTADYSQQIDSVREAIINLKQFLPKSVSSETEINKQAEKALQALKVIKDNFSQLQANDTIISEQLKSWLKDEVDDTDELATKQDIYYCYRILLSREPDKNGYDTWLKRIKQERMNVDDLVLKFLTSAEFRKIYFDIDKPEISKSIERTDINNYIDYCYRLVLNSQPNQKDKKYWQELISRKQLTSIDLVKEFIKISDYSIV